MLLGCRKRRKILLREILRNLKTLSIYLIKHLENLRSSVYYNLTRVCKYFCMSGHKLKVYGTDSKHKLEVYGTVKRHKTLYSKFLRKTLHTRDLLNSTRSKQILYNRDCIWHAEDNNTISRLNDGLSVRNNKVFATEDCPDKGIIWEFSFQ